MDFVFLDKYNFTSFQFKGNKYKYIEEKNGICELAHTHIWKDNQNWIRNTHTHITHTKHGDRKNALTSNNNYLNFLWLYWSVNGCVFHLARIFIIFIYFKIKEEEKKTNNEDDNHSNKHRHFDSLSEHIGSYIEWHGSTAQSHKHTLTSANKNQI